MEELARNWTTIVYFEELGGYKVICDALKRLHYSMLISPIHNPDEESKKKHFHLLMKGEKKSKKQILNILCEVAPVDSVEKGTLKGIAQPQKVHNLRSMVRYFLHLDDLDKEQFEDKKMVSFDFEYEKYLTDTTSKNEIKDIIKLIKDNQVSSLIDLLELFIAFEIDYSYIEKHTYLVNTLIKDFNYNNSNVVKKIINKC